MKMIEKKFTEKIRQGIKDLGGEAFNTQHTKCLSLPDIHFIIPHLLAGWVEAKILKAGERKVKFQNGQARWLWRYWRNGGACFIAVYDEKHDNVDWWAGDKAVLLEKGGYRQATPTVNHANRVNQYQKSLAIFHERTNLL